MIRPIFAITIAAACVSALPAQAQVRHRHAVRVVAERPLTVNKRSWLDSGNVVPVGTADTNYTASTTLNQPIYSSFSPARFGQSTLPGQFDLAFTNENPRGPNAGGIFFDDLP